MSWHFSRALVEAFSEATSSDGARFALLSGSHTPPLFLPSDRTTAFSRLSRFGMTFGHLTDELGADVLMWCQAAFRARTYPSQEKVPASPESAAECGPTWRGSLAKFDPVSCSWKTVQLCLLEDSELSSVTWPRSGMTADGQCWELPMSGRRTGESASGLWPTPLAQDAKHSGYAKSGPGMADKLSYAVVRYQTPVSWMYKDNGKNPSELDRNSPTLAMQAGGSLNPTWVEKLMGWPDEWTSLKPMSHIKMCFWLMGLHDDAETRRNEVLRVLRCGDAAQEIQREIGRPVGVSEAALLLSELCEHSNRSDEARVFVACAEALEEEMRGVQLHAGATGASHRSGQDQQRANEHPDAVQALPRFLAHHGQAHWQDGRWEDAVPRVANGVAARVDRLKAIGNGQVPLCAATAWQILAGG